MVILSSKKMENSITERSNKSSKRFKEVDLDILLSREILKNVNRYVIEYQIRNLAMEAGLAEYAFIHINRDRDLQLRAK